MINAELFTDRSGILCGFCIKGHSGFAESGSDIVCAAVSSASYMTVNTITEILRANSDVIADDGYMMIKIDLSDARKCQDILGGFRLHLCSLEEQYPDYLTVNYLEV